MMTQPTKVTAPLHLIGAFVRGDKDVALPIDIVQEVGASQVNIMSQAAVSEAISKGIVFESYNREQIDAKDDNTLTLAVSQSTEALTNYDREIRVYIDEQDTKYLNEFRDYVHSQDLYYADKTLNESKRYTDDVITNIKLYQIKGRVDSVEDLPIEGNKPFDIYLVGAIDAEEYEEWYWMTTVDPYRWEMFGRMKMDVDLSNYYTKAEVDGKLLPITNNITLLTNNKVDKVLGKQLSTEDFTAEYKSRLASFTQEDINKMLQVNGNETTRISNETVRQAAEVKRQEDTAAAIVKVNEAINATESAVIDAEAAVIAANTAATNASNTNTSVLNAERLRVTAETGRVEAEEVRVAEESIRIANENIRKTQEEARQTDTAAAITAVNTAKTATETATTKANTAATNANTKADLATDAALHPPIIKNGTWWTYQLLGNVPSTTGVYILSDNGNIYSEAEWNANKKGNFIGVCLRYITNSKIILNLIEDLQPTASVPWIPTSAISEEIGASTLNIGETNTKIILEKYGYKANFAASIAYNKISSFNGSHGYLPSLGELAYVLSVKTDIDRILKNAGKISDVSALESAWSSTENAANNAYRSVLTNLVSNTKTNLFKVPIFFSLHNKEYVDTTIPATGEAGKSPKIENGTWWVYDNTTDEYVDTTVGAIGPKGDTGNTGEQGIQGIQGEPGKTPIIQDETWWIYNTETNQYENTGVSVSSQYELTKPKVESVLIGDITTHTHDTRYYTKTEVTNKLSTKLEDAPTTGGQYVRQSGTWTEVDIPEVDLTNYLAKDNTVTYTPTGNYNPATKKYVDDNASSITVGTTTTVTSGTPASVVNSGTEKDVVLEFSIPRGPAGFQGLPGANGAKGDKGDKGNDATINGSNAITLVNGTNIQLTNEGTEFTISTTAEPNVQSDWNVENVIADSFIRNKPNLSVYATKASIGTVNGIAGLDSTGKVPASQLPSYVDDVVEGTLATFPATGETGKIYVDTVDNRTYRWSGSGYVEISQSLALGETSSTAYAGNKGKAVTDRLLSHQENTANPHAVTKAQVGLGNVDNTSDANKPISTAVATKFNSYSTTAQNDAKYLGLDGGTISNALTIDNGDAIATIVSFGSPRKGYVGRIPTAGSAGIYLKNDTSAKEIILKDTGELLYATDKIWHSGNDGAASGLDADKLDGVEGANYALKTDIPNIPVQSVSGKTGAVTLVKGDVGLGNVDNTSDSAKSVASAAKLTTARNINGVAFDGTKDITLTANAADVYTWAKAANKPTYTASEVGALSTAGGTITAPITMKYAGDGIINFQLADGTSIGYIGNIASTGANNGLWVANTKYNGILRLLNSGGITYNDNKVWHAGNDGSGSGLEADLLDGKHASEFATPSSNVASATKLQTARTIWGKSFDGTNNVNGDIDINNNIIVQGVAMIGFFRKGWGGTSWNKGLGAYNVEIANNGSQTPLLLAYRAGTSDYIGENRVFAIELMNSGTSLRFTFGGTEKFIFESNGALTGTAFHGNSDSANKLTNARTIDDATFNGTANVTTRSYRFNRGRIDVSTLASIPTDKASVNATLSAATSISLSGGLNEGENMNIRCLPTTSFTQPIPRKGMWSSMSGSSYTTTANKVFEINIWCFKAGYYSIALREAD